MSLSKSWCIGQILGLEWEKELALSPEFFHILNMCSLAFVLTIEPQFPHVLSGRNKNSCLTVLSIFSFCKVYFLLWDGLRSIFVLFVFN
jgi:hypothetical protein